MSAVSIGRVRCFEWHLGFEGAGRLCLEDNVLPLLTHLCYKNPVQGLLKSFRDLGVRFPWFHGSEFDVCFLVHSKIANAHMHIVTKTQNKTGPSVDRAMACGILTCESYCLLLLHTRDRVTLRFFTTGTVWELIDHTS